MHEIVVDEGFRFAVNDCAGQKMNSFSSKSDTTSTKFSK